MHLRLASSSTGRRQLCELAVPKSCPFMSSIAIIGMACRYPDTRSPRQLWENALAQRRSFRRIPQVRLCVDDYSGGGQTEDRIYLRTAAVLEDYEFNRVRFRVSKET